MDLMCRHNAGSVTTYLNDHEPTGNDYWENSKRRFRSDVVDLLEMNPRNIAE